MHLTPSLLSKPVALITASELTHWRNELIKKGLAPALINHMRNNLRAALELVATHRSHIWKAGLEKLPDTQIARNIVLSDAEVLALVAAIYRHDEGGSAEGRGRTDAIVRLRQRIGEIKATLARTAAAPLPSAFCKRRVQETVEALAAQGKPSVTPLVRRGLDIT